MQRSQSDYNKRADIFKMAGAKRRRTNGSVITKRGRIQRRRRKRAPRASKALKAVIKRVVEGESEMKHTISANSGLFIAQSQVWQSFDLPVPTEGTNVHERIGDEIKCRRILWGMTMYGPDNQPVAAGPLTNVGEDSFVRIMLTRSKIQLVAGDLPVGMTARWEAETLRSNKTYVMMDRLYKLRCEPYFVGLTGGSGAANFDYKSQVRHHKFSTKLRGTMLFPEANPSALPKNGEGPFLQWWVLGDRYYIPGVPPLSNYNVRVQFTDVEFYFKE